MTKLKFCLSTFFWAAAREDDDRVAGAEDRPPLVLPHLLPNLHGPLPLPQFADKET